MFKSTCLRSLALLLGLGVTPFLAGCQKERNSNLVTDKNVVRAGDPSADRSIGDLDVQLSVLGLQTFDRKLADSRIVKPGSPAARNFLSGTADTGGVSPGTGSGEKENPPTPVERPKDSLLLGYPAGLVGQQVIFGGVIVKVSDQNDPNLGALKLTDLTPIHARSRISGADTASPKLSFMGCTDACTETSKQSEVAALPIVGIDTEKKLLVLDLATLGDDLNLLQFIDPTGQMTQLKTKSSKVAGFDFSESTLVFDVETHMVPIEPDPQDPSEVETVFTTRWYLKLNSASNPSFASRDATPGVGFFMTERTASPKVMRHSTTDFGGTSVHYFIKNVPTAFQPAFAKAFDSWNEQFKSVLGRDLLSYEFVPEGDAKNELLVPGDIRFHIVEWDLVNQAPYGGLGPSIANQFTGEILSSNVLIQGPRIVQLYTDWFQTGEHANALRAEGREAEADQLIQDFNKSFGERADKESSVRYEVKLGKLAFRNVSRMASLEDPAMQRNDFDPIPAGYTYDTYMNGYFIEMLAHELGHNMGLRHNFRGNMGATSSTEVGKVSRSIMEYLGRVFRHADRIGTYDTMAIQYGYAGKIPTQLDQFCTDDDVVSVDDLNNSPECSRDDGTNDPFSFFEARLKRGVDLLVARGKTSAPTWAVGNMARELGIAVNGMLFYAATSAENASRLTNFFGKPDRPANSSELRAYGLAKLEAQICDPTLEQVAAQKETPAAQAQTLANLTALRSKVKDLKDQIEPLKEARISCL